MKNQYFGDINDYHKYGILRILANDGRFRIGVCWMLTPDGGRTDGKFTQYLGQETLWSTYDPLLFRALRQAVHIDQQRHIQHVETATIIPSALFYTHLLRDSIRDRQTYFDGMFHHFAEVDLI